MIIRYTYGSGKQAVGGNICAHCGATPVQNVLCSIECEKPISTGEHSWLFWAFFGLLNLPLTLFYSLIKREPTIVSKGKSLEFNLALCPSCQRAGLGADSLKDILRREPAFAHLLAQYPAAQVFKGTPIHN
jgi:hypothetical protein